MTISEIVQAMVLAGYEVRLTFNSIMRNLALPTLSQICLGHEEPEDYEVVPNWAAMRDRAVAAMKQVEEHPRAGWRATIELFSTTPTTPEVCNAKGALDLAAQQLGKPGSFETFSGHGGLYSHVPLPVIAVVGGDQLGDVYVVWDCPDQKKWLIDALAIHWRDCGLCPFPTTRQLLPDVERLMAAKVRL